MKLSPSVRALAGASLFVLGSALALTPQLVRAQGFAGTGTVDFGTATIDTATPGVTNVNLPNSSPRATITWTPTDTGVGGGPIDFLPNGNIVNYTGDVGESQPYTILNRVIPVDPSRSVAFNGLVNSNNNVRVFFYSPGGLLIGSSARINVGGLLLSTSDLVLDGSNDFMPNTGQFSVAGVAGSTSAIEIQAGAEIRAETIGQSNFIVAVAPRIQQDGLVSARGSVALVAAESADFAVDNQGLFNINVTQGTEVATNTLSHTGTTGGPDAAGVGEFRRVYMVAVPKNNAISMAIQSGGSIGFDIAGAADVVGNRIILSAGHNIADSGAGDPIVAAQAGIGSADITISRGSYTSDTAVRSMTFATVADNIVGGTPDISFAADLSVRAASTAAVRADQGIVTIAGAVTVSADAPVNGFAGAAILAAGGAGTSLSAAAATVTASTLVTNSPFASGGNAEVQSVGGTVNVSNGITVRAVAQGADASAGGTGGTAFGGNVAITATNGGTVTTGGAITIEALATGGTGGDNIGDLGGNAQGGLGRIQTSGAGSLVSAANGILIDAGAVAGSAGSTNGAGGNATGGTAELSAMDGNINVTAAGFAGIELLADGLGGTGGQAGNATGGSGLVTASNATISTAGDYGLLIDASATGGDALSFVGNAGSAIGGTVDVRTLDTTGRIETNIGGGGAGLGLFGIELSAAATGGNAALSSTNGGSATGGMVTLAVTGAGQQIINNSAMGTILSVQALGGSAGGGIGAAGDATGGSAIVDIVGGSLSATQGSLSLNASAQGGQGDVDLTGTARGGDASVRVAGVANIAGGINLVADGQAVAGGATKNAFGGRVSLLADGGVVTATAPSSFQVMTVGGSGSSTEGGDALGGAITLSAINGASVSLNGDVDFNTRTLGGNTGGGFGGDAIGTEVTVRAKGADIALGAVSGTVSFQNEATPGTSDFPGQAIVRNALFETDPTGRIALGGAAAGGIGDIIVGGTINPLINGVYLTFSAANTVAMNSSIANTVAGSSIVLRADNRGAGVGNVTFGGGNTLNLSGAGATVDIYHNPALFGTATDYSADVIAGILTPYQLVHDATQLQSINSYLGGSFALARDVDLGSLASSNAGAGFQSIGTDTFGNVVGGVGFTGNFDGQGFTIRNLYINRTTSEVGLFGRVTGGTIRNVILSDGSVTSSGSNVGSLVGNLENATLSNAHSSVNVSTSAGGDIGGLVGHVGTTSAVKDSSASGTVINIGGPHSTGGLVGYNGGTILRSWATGNVTLDGTNRGVGGLVGFSDGFIDQSYATGSVTGGLGIHGVGGLVGFISNGTVSRSYATGDVSGPLSVGAFVGYIAAAGTASTSYGSGAVTGSTDIGGFVGTNQGSTSNSYWDNFSTGQSVGFGSDVGSITNLNAVTSDPGQSAAPNYAFDPNAYANFTGSDWTNFSGQSRPIGAWEITRPEYGLYTVRSAHQLQFVQNDLGGNYRLAFDISAFEFQTGGSVLLGGSFIPLGDGVTPFTGQFDGAGHVVSSLHINRPTGNLGLFDTNGGTIRDLGLTNVFIVGGTNRVGALAGTNNGLITGSFATGLVNGTGNATGGLVGDNNNTGTITQSYASVDVTGANTAGGLVGLNAGAISFSYANGPVTGMNAGGLVGTNATLATVGDSYWDTQISGRANACGTDDGTNCSAATGLTTAQSMQAASYTGWSLDTVGGQPNIWRIYEGTSAPLLKSFLRKLPLTPLDTSLIYSGVTPGMPVIPLYADPARIFGTATLAGLNPNVGNHSVTYVGGLTSNQLGYDLFAGAPGTLTITPAGLIVTADTATRLYGDANPVFTYSTVGLRGADTLSGALDTTANLLSGIGNYAITQGTLGNPNYAITFTDGTLTVIPRPLGVTADAATRLYGDSNPAFTYTASGLVNGDTLTGALDSLATVTSNVGTFTINQGTLAASANYALTYTGANLDVLVRPITVTGDTLGRAYGDANPALTYSVGGAGLVNGDLLTGTLATLADGLSSVGTYGVTQGTLSASGNYSLTYVDGSLNVVQRGLTITADPNTRLYGDSNPAFTYTVGGAGLVNGDTLSGALDSLATVTSNIGTYAVDQGTLSAGGNYAISYVSDTLTVTPRPLGVTADANTRLYGDANPAFTYVATGLVNGDTLTGALNSLATITSNIGTYTIDQGTLASSANYALSYTGANLDVLVRPITVTGDVLNRLYGDVNPALTYTVGGAGLVNGDTLAGTADTLANLTSNIGAYGVTQGTLASSANYALTYVDGTLNVTPRPLSVVADLATRLYGDANPVFTYTATGLVNGDTLTGSPDSLATVTSNVGIYSIDQATLAASTNYALNYTSANLDVLVRPLLVTGDALGRLYGDANPALTYTVGGAGLVNGDLLTGALDSVATVTSNVGIFGVTQGTLAASANYALTYVDGTLAVTPRPLAVVADAATRFYGDANPILTYVSTGLVNGDTLSGALDSAAIVTSNVGTFAINLGTLENSNYAISYTGANLDVLVRPITVTGDTLNRLYGDANPALTYSIGGAGLVNGDTLSGALDTLANGTSNIGAYGVTQGTLASSANYVLTYVDGTLNVTPRPLSVVADLATRLYGDANPVFTYTATGLVNGDTLTGSVDSLATVTSNVGTYNINQATLSASANYLLSYTGANLNVTPRPLSVTADVASRLYGDVNPAFTYSATGLVNGDTLTGVLDSLATVTSNVGAYAIDQGTLASSANYALTYNSANLSVTPRALIVTADAASRIYGDANPAFTYIASGLVNGDTLTGALDSSATATSNIGAYGIGQGTLSSSANYVLSFSGANLSVTPRPLSVTADAASRLYGDANPAFTFTSNGLVNGDVLTGSLSSLATVTSSVGSYGIDQGSLAASANYALTYTGNTLGVLVRPISVTGDASTRVYGDANPALTYSVGGAGLVNGDTLSGALTTAANAASNVGSYATTQGTLAASANYVLTYVDGTLAVTPRALSVAADAASRLYGDANPAFTYTATGLVNGDVLSGALDSLATVTSNVGAYGIDQGTLTSSANYVLTYNGASLSVTPRPLSVTANTASRLYGDANPAFTFNAVGLVNGDTLSGALNSAAGLASNVGTYGIDQGSLASSANYVLSYTGASLDVLVRPITVTGDALSRVYGDANPALTYTVAGAGLVNGDTLSGVLDSTANATSNIGSYATTQGTLAASSNYVISYTSGSLSVTPRALTVTADGASRVYGDANPALTFTSVGLVNGDLVSGSLSTSAGVASGFGSFAIVQGSVSANSNYVLTYNGASLTITPRSLTITADAQSRFFGNENPVLTYVVGGSGLVNGDALSGGLSTGADTVSPLGIYAIGQGNLAATPNYNVTYVGANLTVIPCDGSSSCAPPPVVMEAVSQIASEVQQQSEDPEATEEAKEEAAAQSAADPEVLINSVVDTSAVSKPEPILEPVSGSGNSTLWIPGGTQ